MRARILALLLAVAVLLSCAAIAEGTEGTDRKPVVILYTNDVHCAVDENMGYSGVAAYREAYEANGYETLLVDCGDAIQGGPIGTVSKGEYIVDIMNALGYDVATLGNHEFDYGIDRLMELKGKASYTYLCCNFLDNEDNAVFDGYTVIEKGGWKIGIVGVTTPRTFTSSTPTYFQDGEGNFIYSFCGGDGGKQLYQVVQQNVDAAIGEGAEIVIALTHLGTEAGDAPYTSSDLIANTTGIDAVLDAHSHSTWNGELEKNASGEDVLMSSTGTKLENLGVLTITPEGEMSTELHGETIFRSESADAVIDVIKADLNALLNEVVAHTDVDLTITDPTAVDEEGKPIRIIRRQETNLGDLCADAYRELSGADIGLVNGGGIRKTIAAGDITYENIINVHPFGNMLCVVEATGQQIMDALEISVKDMPGEYGGFLQVSGLTFEVDMSVASTVVMDDYNMFVRVEGDRRVRNVLVAGEPIEAEKTYTVASHNYLLKDGGDGIAVFMNDTVVQDDVMLDNQVLINYIVERLGGTVGEKYAEPYGQGRITILQ